MDMRLKECMAKRVRDDVKAHQDLVNASKFVVTKYFNHLKTPGANKDICLRRLRTEFQFIISKYRENLHYNASKFEENAMELHLTELDLFMDSFYQESYD